MSSAELTSLSLLKKKQNERRTSSQQPRAPGAAPTTAEEVQKVLEFPTAPPPDRKKAWVHIWKCMECGNDCNIIRSENRCLCGHRYKEHGNERSSTKCAVKGCPCKCFFYMCAEGAWIIRCRCKHKHTDHDPSKAPYPCTKCKQPCKGFDSPFVCNCNHGWAQHRQVWEERELKSLPELDNFGDPALIKRGLEEVLDDLQIR